MTDTISRADAIEAKPEYRNEDMLDKEKSAYNKGWNDCNDAWVAIIKALPSAEQTDCTDFVNWLLEKVMDEEMWELNAVAYGEIIARKLKNLGLLEVKDGYYIRHIENNTKPSDLVYRPSADAEQVTGKLKKPCDSLLTDDSDECKEQRNKLESAEAEWIPCSERLPKAEDMYQPPEQRYLCQLEAYGERKFCVLSRLKGAISPFWDWYGVAVHDSEVTAWMPLPTPYKGGEDE